MNRADNLNDLHPEKPFFIGIDSDGTVFDSMELKHKECFAPMFIQYFGLQAVSKVAREVWDFVNLYSTTRGVNRFVAVVHALHLLRDRPEVSSRHALIPDTQALEAWIARESKLSNAMLQREVEGGNEALAPFLAWSDGVNRAVETMVTGLPPLPLFQESLEKMVARADVLVVSQTPTEALEREWNEHGIDRLVRGIAGQELGTKSEHLRDATAGRYPPENILMIGDAPGDLEAARNNQALFFPIVPGREEASWDRFYTDAADRFFAGTYAGTYEHECIREFEQSLPDTPPWQVRDTAAALQTR